MGDRKVYKSPKYFYYIAYILFIAHLVKINIKIKLQTIKKAQYWFI
jgi:hypothetical protein